MKMNKSEYFVHQAAIVEPNAKIGMGTRVWAFAHILQGASIGADCNICDHVFIENDVVIGDRVTVKSGVQLWDGVRLDDDVFVGPNATFSNDLFPRSKKHPEKFLQTIVCKGASIGANATILPGIKIGINAMVGAGAVVTREVPPFAIVVGNPARIKGYTSTTHSQTIFSKAPSSEPDAMLISKARLIKLPYIVDLRGGLSFGEYDKHLPFIPKRYFIVFDVPSKEIRGEHAHRMQHQFLICVKGSCSVILDDGHLRTEVLLDRPNTGLYLPPMIWGIQYKYSAEAILLVLASDVYDATDYIRDYDSFLREVNE